METKKTTSFDFWQAHSETFLKMAFATGRRESLVDPDGRGSRSGTCGDSITYFLIIADDRVDHVAMDVVGCVNTLACANGLAELVEGRSVKKAWGVRPQQVADYLETLPQHEFHCAEMAVGALQAALRSWRSARRHPWKKGYRRSETV